MIINLQIDESKIEYYREDGLVEATVLFMGRMFKGCAGTKAAAKRSLKSKIETALQGA